MYELKGTSALTDAEKIAAFDNLAIAMTNCWHDGRWSWWCPTPSGSTETPRETREEALADLVAWADYMAKRDAGRHALRKRCKELGDAWESQGRSQPEPQQSGSSTRCQSLPVVP